VREGAPARVGSLSGVPPDVRVSSSYKSDMDAYKAAPKMTQKTITTTKMMICQRNAARAKFRFAGEPPEPSARTSR